jgi:glycine cleavage system H protein
MDPKTLRYSKTHEWVHVDGDICTIGLTQFAVEQLTDIIFIDLPDVADPVISGDSFGEVESVKAVNDIYSPISGDITEVNKKLESEPGLISADPYGKGWLIKVRVSRNQTFDHLLTAEQYAEQIKTEGEAH